MSLKTTFLTLCAATAVAVAALVFGLFVRSPYAHPLIIGDTKIWVAYAVTPAEQEQGLSGTKPLRDDQGMLFIFPSDTSVSFWMKDMNYPLDIIWIDSEKTVRDISPDLDPATYPTTFAPSIPVRYALEVPAGFAAQNAIEVGTKVSFD